MKPTFRITVLSLFAITVAGVLQAQTLTFGRRTYAGNTTYTHIDLNGDGREDLVYPTVGASGPSGFTVVLSNGNGTYAAPVFYAAPNSVAQNIVLLDINNDGYPDLFTWNGGNNLYEYLNDRSGAFHLQATYQLSSLLSVAVGDFNHDGYLDIAYLAVATSPKGQIHVLFNNHASGFSVGPVTYVPTTGQISVGDFDGDGKADIFIQGSGSGNPSTICYGNNAGNFSTQTNASTSHSPFLFPMDIDGDGKTDLVGAGLGSNPSTHQNIYYKDLFVIYGTANRTVTETAIPLNGYPVPTVTGSGFNEPSADQADFNGDGKADLVTVEALQADGGGNTRRLVVLTGKGNRAFNPEDDQSIQTTPAVSTSTCRPSTPTPTIRRTSSPTSSPTTPPTAFFFLNDTSGWFGGCPLPTSATGIHLCSPTTYTSTTAAFSLSAAGVPLMHRMELWIDGVKKYQQFARDYSHSAFLDTTLTLAPGTHKVSVYAAGQDNSLQNKTYTITVK